MAHAACRRRLLQDSADSCVCGSCRWRRWGIPSAEAPRAPRMTTSRRQIQPVAAPASIWAGHGACALVAARQAGGAAVERQRRSSGARRRSRARAAALTDDGRLSRRAAPRSQQTVRCRCASTPRLLGATLCESLRPAARSRATSVSDACHAALRGAPRGPVRAPCTCRGARPHAWVYSLSACAGATVRRVKGTVSPCRAFDPNTSYLTLIPLTLPQHLLPYPNSLPAWRCRCRSGPASG